MLQIRHAHPHRWQNQLPESMSVLQDPITLSFFFLMLLNNNNNKSSEPY